MAAFDGASESWEGSANDASCQVALLLQVGPTQALWSAGGLAEGAGHDAAVLTVVSLFQLIRVKVLGDCEQLRCSRVSFSVCVMVSRSSTYPSLAFNPFICFNQESYRDLIFLSSTAARCVPWVPAAEAHAAAVAVVMFSFRNFLFHSLLPSTTFSFFMCISDLLFWFNILNNFSILLLLTD